MGWRLTTISPDGTHHLLAGRPAYEGRFDEVLKFHEPGLAPVRLGEHAWHIGLQGDAAYARRLRRTFGFYEERAAVVDDDGWFHILPDGEDLLSGRYDWCGNFQGGRCSVRLSDAKYRHVDLSGRPAYDWTWSYAGDYRDGVAVVQDDSGRSTHIDEHGQLLHGQWFLDLDVFHKGLARARDDQGWTHIDRSGRPAYHQRFAMVEPFYNGQARVECKDGGLLVVDESGKTLLSLRPPLRREFAALSGDLVGFWRTRTICAAVELGVLEALPASSDQAALALGLDPDRCHRLLRALGELRLVESAEGGWTVSSRGSYLTKGDALTLADAALEYGHHFDRMWSAVPEALRATGSWRAPDVFREVAADPARVEGHHRMLRSYARHDYGAIPDALGLRGDERVVDAGGGLGALAELVLRRFPGVRAVLIDRPEVLQLVSIPPELEERLELRPTDLFAPWGVRVDAVLLARVLHDWDDDDASRILRNARDALPVGGRVLVVEMVLPEPGTAGGLCDLHLLMATGGQERTEPEYAALLDGAGFDLLEVRDLPALPSVMVGVAR